MLSDCIEIYKSPGAEAIDLCLSRNSPKFFFILFKMSWANSYSDLFIIIKYVYTKYLCYVGRPFHRCMILHIVWRAYTYLLVTLYALSNRSLPCSCVPVSKIANYQSQDTSTCMNSESTDRYSYTAYSSRYVQ